MLTGGNLLRVNHKGWWGVRQCALASINKMDTCKRECSEGRGRILASSHMEAWFMHSSSNRFYQCHLLKLEEINRLKKNGTGLQMVDKDCKGLRILALLSSQHHHSMQQKPPPLIHATFLSIQTNTIITRMKLLKNYKGSPCRASSLLSKVKSNSMIHRHHSV